VEIFLVVKDIDLGYDSFGAYSSEEKAREAIEEFCVKETERLSSSCAVVKRTDFYIVVHTLDAPCKYV
jgi:hypothetical protein